jgi:DUF971 family protein
MIREHTKAETAVSVQPIRLALTPDRQLVIDWDDGQSRRYAIEQLRANCPCAACEAQRRGSSSAQPLGSVDPELTIRYMDAVGNYAYRILFSDGHETGIFTLDLLRRLGSLADR